MAWVPLQGYPRITQSWIVILTYPWLNMSGFFFSNFPRICKSRHLIPTYAGLSQSTYLIQGYPKLSWLAQGVSFPDELPPLPLPQISKMSKDFIQKKIMQKKMIEVTHHLTEMWLIVVVLSELNRVWTVVVDLSYRWNLPRAPMHFFYILYINLHSFYLYTLKGCTHHWHQLTFKRCQLLKTAFE